MSSMTFSALYYPYSRCLREVDLKRMILIFDEIVFIDPLSRDLAKWPGQYPVPNENMNMRLMQDSDRLEEDGFVTAYQRGVAEADYPLWRWYNIRETYRFLLAKKIVRQLDPKTLVQRHDQMLACAVVDDLLTGLSRRAGLAGHYYDGDEGWNPKWRLHECRIPHFLSAICADDSFWNKVFSAGRRGYSAKTCRLFIEQAIKAKANNDDGIALVDFDVAYSLVLNQALLISNQYQLFPVTDDAGVHNSLIRKCERFTAERQIIGSIFRRRVVDLYKISLLTINAVSRVIPDQALAALSVEDLISYREANLKQLCRFWNKMLELASELSESPNSEKFAEQVGRIIESKIVPEITQLQDALTDSFQKMFSGAIAKLISHTAKALAPAIPTISLAAIYGLTPAQIVGLGVSSLLTGIGITLPGVVSEIEKQKQLKRSSFAYLLNVPNDDL